MMASYNFYTHFHSGYKCYQTGKGYKIKFHEVRKCSSQGTGEIVWDLRLNRLSRDHLVIEGNISLAYPLDNKISGNMVVSEKVNGYWVERVFVYKMNNLCFDMNLVLKSVWANLWEHAGITPPITCPIKEGNYTVRNFTTDGFENNMFPGMKLGMFKIDMEFLKRYTNTVLGCTRFIVDSSTLQ